MSKTARLVRIRSLVFLCIVTLILILPSVSSNDVFQNYSDDVEVISQTFRFSEPEITSFFSQGERYDHVTIDSCVTIGYDGFPELPIRSVQLLLPLKSTVSSIRVEVNDVTYLGKDFFVSPASSQHPSSASVNFSQLVKNESVYSSSTLYPGVFFRNQGIQSYRGYQLLLLTLFPIQYSPSSQELYFYDTMAVIIETEKDNTVSSLLREKLGDVSSLKDRIDNPSDLVQYSVSSLNPFDSSEDYQFLIITSEALKDTFLPLQEKRNDQGLSTRIATLEDISPFQDITAEDIREYIRQEYIEHGIEYVLLGGDIDVVPAKYLYFGEYNGHQYTGPSDLYYACLDGSFNSDGDSYWGESNDGNNGGDVDLIAEVNLGRASVGNQKEADYFVEKTLSYEETLESRALKVLLVGEKLWETPLTWGGDYLDELLDFSISNFYTTTGIPTDEFNVTFLYDRDVNDHDWPVDDLVTLIAENPLIVNHMGHSFYEYSMKINNQAVLDSMVNSKPFFVYSQGCMAGGFDQEDCFAEYITVKQPHGAVAGIFNSRYGWFSQGSTYGVSQRFNREFWDAVYGEHIPVFGKAHNDAKEDLIGVLTFSRMRWVYYELNLFGDPALSFYVSDNTAPELVTNLTGPRLGIGGKSYDFEVKASDAEDDDLYFQVSWGDETFSNWVGPVSSNDVVSVSHMWKKMGKYILKVRVRDEHGVTTDWSEERVFRILFPKQILIKERFLDFLQDLFSKI